MKPFDEVRAAGIVALTLTILAAAVASQALGGSQRGSKSAGGLGP